MDASDAIEYLAVGEAARLDVMPRHQDLAYVQQRDDLSLPWFHVERNRGMWAVTEAGGHEGHDNEGRLQQVCDFVQHRVLPLVRDGSAVGGYYRVELHDSYSYLAGRERYRRAGAFTFSRPCSSAHADRMALLPDPYQMTSYGGLVSAAAKDNVAWADKAPTLFFAGTTTGNRDPLHNARIKACVWSLSHPADACRLRITNIAQMSGDAACRAWGAERWNAVLAPMVPLEEHWRYKYQVNLVGNTACWSRVPMVLASRSLLVHVRHDDATWYYPLLREGEHYVSARSHEELAELRQGLMADDGRCQEIVRSANRFCASHLTSLHAAHYTARLLEAAGERCAA